MSELRSKCLCGGNLVYIRPRQFGLDHPYYECERCDRKYSVSELGEKKDKDSPDE